MTSARRLLCRVRIARIVARVAVSPKSQWIGYAPLGRPLTRRERWRGSRAYRILTIPVAILRAPLEVGER